MSVLHAVAEIVSMTEMADMMISPGLADIA